MKDFKPDNSMATTTPDASPLEPRNFIVSQWLGRLEVYCVTVCDCDRNANSHADSVRSQSLSRQAPLSDISYRDPRDVVDCLEPLA